MIRRHFSATIIWYSIPSSITFPPLSSYLKWLMFDISLYPFQYACILSLPPINLQKVYSLYVFHLRSPTSLISFFAPELSGLFLQTRMHVCIESHYHSRFLLCLNFCFGCISLFLSWLVSSVSPVHTITTRKYFLLSFFLFHHRFLFVLLPLLDVNIDLVSFHLALLVMFIFPSPFPSSR